MAESRFARSAVIGAGMMGPGIAVVLAGAGDRVALVGRTAASVRRAEQRLDAVLASLAQNGLSTAYDAAALRDRIWITDRLDAAVGDAALVIESIGEELTAKQDLFANLEQLCGSETLLASNTSGLRISDIVANLAHPERTATTHFWNPPHVVPLVEITKGEQTSEATVTALVDLLKRCGKTPVVALKDVPGQIANRLQHALLREALYLVQEGVASAADVDLALNMGPGRRWPVYGVLEHQDIVGLELALAVQQALVPDLCSARAPLPILENLIKDGHVGVSSGQGLYDWHTRDAAAVIARRDAFLRMLARDWPVA